MPLGDHGYNYIFDARDNVSGFLDGRVIRTKTGFVLVSCIEEYYLHYPFVREFVMDRGSECTCQEVQELLSRNGVVANYTTTAHPQADAPVKRGHNIIMNLLAKWTEGRPNQWPRYLRAAFFVENITVRRTTKYASVTLWSDFAKTAMPRGGRGTRLSQRSLGASGGYERNGSHNRESTPVYDDGDIELFLDEFWGYANHMGWTMTQAIGRLRRVDRFTEPFAQIRRETRTRPEVEARTQELAHLREVFRRPEQPQPRVERRLRSRRQRDPEPTEARLLQRGRKALSRREEEMVPETEGQGTYPEYGLGPVKFHRFPEGGQGVSPLHIWEEVSVSRESLQKLEAHLDVSQWKMPPVSERRDEPVEGVPRKEVQSLERERGPSTEGGRVEEEVIEVEEDTPPQMPAVGLRLGSPPRSAPRGREESQREEVRPPLPKMVPPPEGMEERETERADQRKKALALIDRHLAEQTLKHPDLEEPVPMEPPQEPYGIKEMWKEFLIQHGKELTAPDKAGVETSQKADEYLDRRIRSLSKTSFDKYMMLEVDLRGKEMRETSQGVRLEAVEVEVREFRVLVVSQAAIIRDLEQQLHGRMGRAESSRQGEQRQPELDLSRQSAATVPQ
ncbi:hypothetical protein CBR_g23050 [Chara braunii]|uniref:Integrase catalytic domain-containing protein n=1 Tax=Chara braunii TaxID=69332 RepID=A0A388L3E9_CHABU|nr:hypothetical protein CBR_g23050 [Chara braunii]|eukprot:GBG76834.1 hypothetical protein CBR_g23050 [Chara braunii]